jgi:hypothetical protein
VVTAAEHELYPDDLEYLRRGVLTDAQQRAELDTITEVAAQLHQLRANGYTPGKVLHELGIYRPRASWAQCAYYLAKWAAR